MSIWQGLYIYGGQLWAAWKGEVGDDQIFCSQFEALIGVPRQLSQAIPAWDLLFRDPELERQ